MSYDPDFEPEPHSLLTQVQALYDEGNQDDAVDLLLNTVDPASFDYMGEVCRAATARAETLDMSLLVSLLTITFSCKDQVTCRDWLFAATMARAVEKGPDRVRGLLQGLEGSGVTPWR